MDINAMLEELKKKALEWLAQNGGQIPNIPGEPTKPQTPDTPVTGGAIQSDKFFGLMLTDVLCEPNLESRQSGLLKLRTKYNTILSVLDLQRNGAKATRPYVQWARDRESLNALGEKNIKYLKSLGFKLVVVCLSSWGAKHDFGAQMGSTQEDLNGEISLYSSKQLAREKAFYSDFLSKVGGEVDVIMPLLEAIQPQAADFGTELAKHIRALGYRGQIWFNHLSGARSALNQQTLSSLGVKMASSLGSEDAWMKSGDPIRNADGMQSLTKDNTGLISRLTANGGRDGFILWAADLIGNTSGRPTYSDNYLTYAKHVGGTITTPTKPTTPVVTPEIPGESPEARHKRLYPKVQLTGGNAGTATNKTLWKPQADVNGKPTGNLVIVTAHNFPKINYVSVEKNGTVIEKKGIDTVITAGNGYRLNWRFSKKGGSYGTGLTLRISTVEGDYIGSISNGGSRVDPVDMKKVSNIPVPQDPKPDPKPQDPIKPEVPVVTPINKWFVVSNSSIWFHPRLQATIERAVMCYNLPNNLYENGKYIGNNTWQFSKPFTQYQRGSMDSVIGVKVTKMLPQLKDMWRSNGTYQINPTKNIFDDPHTTPHPPVPPPNEDGDIIDNPRPEDPKPENPPVNSGLPTSVNGVLTVPKYINDQILRAQVIHTYNGYYPAFDVSGAKGVGIEKGFQWINKGKNKDGIYNAGQPLAAFPKGKLGGAFWLLSSNNKSPPFLKDGNMVVKGT